MINDTLASILKEQLNREFYSSYLYLSMSAHFSHINLSGFANWTRIQAQEELEHAMLIYDYLINRGEKIYLSPIEAPPNNWESPLSIMQEVLKHEKYITESINNVLKIAEDIKDRATISYFMWFIDEQIEEETNVEGIIASLKFIENDKSALFLLNKELEARTFNPTQKK